jgi:hypothetical protein
MGPKRVAPIYLPFMGGKFRLSMGLMPIPDAAWLEFGENFAASLARKRELLETRHGEVFQALPEAAPAARELLDLLATHLTYHHSALFRTEGPRLLNITTGEAWELAASALHPLDMAGRLVSEDLCLLQATGERYLLTGASLCSPARWRLADKLGTSLAAIHGIVPGYAETLSRPVDHFFAALKPDRLVCRFNWGISDDPAPFQPVAPPRRVEVTRDNAGAALWLRVERQTLRRLPRTGAVVFAIGTHITRLDRAIRSSDEAQDLSAAIRDMPPDMRQYKQIAPFASVLLAWLAGVT